MTTNKTYYEAHRDENLTFHKAYHAANRDKRL
jgi:hypothetical protein